MNLAIVHLTDLHLEASTDRVMMRGPAIAAAITPRMTQAEIIVLAITGDLSMSGQESQLLDASSLLDEVRSILATTATPNICVAIIPGNHDCDFRVEGDLRPALLRGIEPHQSIPDEILHPVVEPLRSFFEIRDELFSPTQSASPLTWSYEAKTEDVSILVRCFNTAWCSTLNEAQGKLYFPVDRLPDESTKRHDLVIALLHHPTHWLDATNRRVLRNHLENTADLVLTGHEHVHDQRFVSKPTGQSIQYIEGIALHDNVDSQTGFNLINIDTAEKRQQVWTFIWNPDDNRYVPEDEDPPQTDLQVNRARKRNEFEVTEHFRAFLDDLGLEVNHPTAGPLTRQQAFSYPQLRRIRLKKQRGDELVGAESLVNHLEDRRLLLITGDEESGKTTLAKALFDDLLSSGVVPVYIRAGRRQERRLRSPDLIDAIIGSAVTEQYGRASAERYRQLDPDQRALIIDDYDKAIIPHHATDDVLTYLTSSFGRVYLLADAMAQQLRRIQNQSMGPLEERRDAAHFRIQPFGYQRRNSMVEQWMLLNDELANDPRELVRQTEYRNRVLDTVIGKNLVPAYPVYILGVLQASESGGAVNLQASVNAHYYELFIKNALALTSDTIEYSVKTSFLAFLAFDMLENESTCVSEERFQALYQDFRDEYDLPIGHEQLVGMLKRSRLLVAFGEHLEFKYEYCFYYFSALYLTKNLGDEGIRGRIRQLADSIYEERNANIFLFLTHLSEDTFILDEMLRCARGMFADRAMATLEGDIAFLGDGAETLLGSEFWDAGDIGELRRIALARRDEKTGRQDGWKEGDDGAKEYVAVQRHIERLGAAFKTLQILGQVLKNFPGSIRAPRKMEIAHAAYGVALRALSDMLSLLDNSQTRIVIDFMEHHLDVGDAAGYTEAFQMAKGSLAGLTRLVAFGAVSRIVAALGGTGMASPSPSVKKVAEEIRSPISKLTVFGMELDYAKRFPLVGLKGVHGELTRNTVAVSVLQYLVVRHMHLFSTPYDLRQKACAELGIQYKRLRIASADPRRKLLGSPEKG